MDAAPLVLLDTLYHNFTVWNILKMISLEQFYVFIIELKCILMDMIALHHIWVGNSQQKYTLCRNKIVSKDASTEH